MHSFNYAYVYIHVYNLLVINWWSCLSFVHLFVMIHYTVQTYSLVNASIDFLLFIFNWLSYYLWFLFSISLGHKIMSLRFVFYRKILLEVWICMKIYQPDKIGPQRGSTALLVELSQHCAIDVHAELLTTTAQDVQTFWNPLIVLSFNLLWLSTFARAIWMNSTTKQTMRTHPHT